MKALKRIISCFLTFTMACSVLPFSVKADYATQTKSFWSRYVRAGVYSVQDMDFFGHFLSTCIALGSSKVCSASPDQVHHADSYEGIRDKNGRDYILCFCKYCGAKFQGYEEDLSAAYDSYVSTLPADNINSQGLSNFYLTGWTYKSSDDVVIDFSSSEYPYVSAHCVGNQYVTLVAASGTFQVPKTGNYRVVFPKPTFEGGNLWVGNSTGNFYKWSAYSGEVAFFTWPSSVSSSGINFVSGGSEIVVFQASTTYHIKSSIGFYGAPGMMSTYKCDRPYIEGVQVVPSGDTTYNSTTRPTSITGGNYGIVGDNGQITKVEDNSTIINETNNTYYNPATGQTVPITGWTYDYSDRSYKVTMEGGKTSTVTYGDENISITETTVNESGDTITNNYTIYYLIDGAGSETTPCEHTWSETSTTPATCTLSGSKLLTCSKCQQTKTEIIPALGHDWQVKQSVTTEYDDTGQLVQEGYTIFECSRCHEQYKSPDGTIPPGGGSGTDPGGEEEGGGFLSWLFGKIGELLGTIGDGILNLLQTALEKIFGGLIDLVNSLFENVAKLVDLFGSVGEAFQVLWTWLPPEITAILVAGVSIFVFVALLKFFTK